MKFASFSRVAVSGSFVRRGGRCRTDIGPLDYRTVPLHTQTDRHRDRLTDRHTERHRERWTEKLEIHAKWIFSSLDVLLLMLYFTMLYFTVCILGLVFMGSY